MDNTPVRRKPHTSTADLLVWSETDSPATTGVSVRSHQPSDGIRKTVFGGQVTDEEVESLNKRKPCSGYKMKEITGSGIFLVPNEEDESSEADNANPSSNNRSGLRMYQQALSGISHISFSEEESVSSKKPVSVAEVAKQRELSGSMESESEAILKRQISDAKNKELSGNNIFAPPPEILPRENIQRPLALKESVHLGESSPRNSAGSSGEEAAPKSAKKIYDQKSSDLSGNNVFKGDSPLSAAEKSLSMAKLREISGNDIFADGKVESRDYLGGVRKPPGGESSIALV
ncbi:hypothetical protein ACFE04_016087 [Oxalis oulophora]